MGIISFGTFTALNVRKSNGPLLFFLRGRAPFPIPLSAPALTTWIEEYAAQAF